mgnify:CR=1 FL=1
MEFEQQIENLKIIVDLKPKYYLTWQNKEKGRDKFDCYERIELNPEYIIYVNNFNKNSIIESNNPPFEIIRQKHKIWH